MNWLEIILTGAVVLLLVSHLLQRDNVGQLRAAVINLQGRLELLRLELQAHKQKATP